MILYPRKIHKKKPTEDPISMDDLQIVFYLKKTSRLSFRHNIPLSIEYP